MTREDVSYIFSGMTNEFHFFASVDICRKCVSCSFDPLTGRSSLGNLHVCACYFSPLSTSFAFHALKVIRFSYVGLCGTMRHSCDRAFIPKGANVNCFQVTCTTMYVKTLCVKFSTKLQRFMFSL